MTFDESKHARGTGAQGGQFVSKDAGGKTVRTDHLSFDGKRGTGYGLKGGDANVKSLQRELNRLGVLDTAGNQLTVDGKLGPKTTSAVKRLQRKLGMTADGRVTPKMLAAIRKLKPSTKTRIAMHVRHARHMAHIHRPLKTTPAKKAAPKKAAKKPAPAKKVAPAKTYAPARKA